jgi:hypothetical protein
MNGAGKAVERVVQVLQAYVMQAHPAADTVLLCGSHAVGRATEGSDIDAVILFPRLDSAWRETVSFRGEVIEAFCHDPGTLRYFFRQMDQSSARPVLPNMVRNGIVVPGFPSRLAAAAKQAAGEIVRAGPPKLTERDLRGRRYVITDLAEDLRGTRTPHEITAIGVELYRTLSDFALRAANRWSANGKAVPEALKQLDRHLALRFERSFSDLFARADSTAVLELVDAVLEPYGGRLQAGFRMDAPSDWRET